MWSPRQDDHVLGLLAADRVDVLIDRVGGAHVPVGAGALHGRQQLKELAQLLGHDAGPAFADVPVERKRLVLGQDEDSAQAGVDAVGEGDVDDAVVAAKRHRRFGAIAGEREEPFSGSARKQDPKSVFHIRIDPAFALAASDRMRAGRYPVQIFGTHCCPHLAERWENTT